MNKIVNQIGLYQWCLGIEITWGWNCQHLIAELVKTDSLQPWLRISAQSLENIPTLCLSNIIKNAAAPGATRWSSTAVSILMLSTPVLTLISPFLSVGSHFKVLLLQELRENPLAMSYNHTPDFCRMLSKSNFCSFWKKPAAETGIRVKETQLDFVFDCHWSFLFMICLSYNIFCQDVTSFSKSRVVTYTVWCLTSIQKSHQLILTPWLNVCWSRWSAHIYWQFLVRNQ